MVIGNTTVGSTLRKILDFSEFLRVSPSDQWKKTTLNFGCLLLRSLFPELRLLQTDLRPLRIQLRLDKGR